MSNRIAQAAQLACLLEVSAAKPGNVNRLHDFSDLHFEDFLRSAMAIGPAMENANRYSVGQIVSHAIQDTRRIVKTNANLGIVLLLAPLVKACSIRASDVESGKTETEDLARLREHLESILAGLTVNDARLTYEAIRTVHAGGLGKVNQSDINEEPTITLLQAMALAQKSDSIASEYVSRYAITFEIGFPALKETMGSGSDLPSSIVQAFLVILSCVPDTLIARKKGKEKAIQVSGWARQVVEKGGVLTPGGQAAITELDRGLRKDGHNLNPGTTADLTAAAVFLHLYRQNVLRSY
ncbi:MAG: triphosphoribosyl-dephospho-CoA synthase [Anaerolineaceae bacterium]|nr:triphosphoribosyl-dephospho-CoA synthase [Anaerolineaceae bacterium]